MEILETGVGLATPVTGFERTEEQLEHQRMLAMRAWEMRPLRHPAYRRRRIAEGRELVRHALGTLIVLGALVLIAQA